MPFSTSSILTSPLHNYATNPPKFFNRRTSVTTSSSTTSLTHPSLPKPSLLSDSDSLLHLAETDTLQHTTETTKTATEQNPVTSLRRHSQQLPLVAHPNSSVVSQPTTDPLTATSAARSTQNTLPESNPEIARLAPAVLSGPQRSADPGPSPGTVPSKTQSKPVLSVPYQNTSPSTPPSSTAPAPSRTTSQAQTAAPSVDDRRRKLSRPQNKAETRSLRGDSSSQENDKKMHQTSSRLLRMTDDERPYTRDFKDLFATLIVSLPLTAHRVRFQKVDHTFTSEEAITNLGSLKFSQSNRMPDPKDPSRIVTTTTTTTFSMAKEMARSVCQKFLDARFIESVDGKIDFTSKSAVWQLTPKGMHILHRFCLRNGIAQDHVKSIIESPRNCMKLVILERDVESDRLSHDAATVEVIFRRFAGPAPNVKTEAAVSDSDSIHEYATGLVGVKMLNDRKVGDRFYKLSFTGKAATDWLMDCCTMVDKRETYEVASLFVEFGLIRAVEGFGNTTRFQASKGAIYYVTERGQVVAGWLSGPTGSLNGDSASKLTTPGNMVGRDSNANRMQVIVKDPALRLLFREYLRHTHCEENLSFYLDVSEFLTNYRTSKKSTNTPKLEFIRETLASAYSLYNAFLAPGSPCELNIDHSLRIALASRMTRAVGDDDAMIRSLDEVANLFDQAQTTVFKLMATDSVPKFSRDPKYVNVLKERNLDFGNSSQ